MVAVPDVLEVGRDHGVERLLDELLHIAEALDDQRRLAVVDMDDHRERQERLEGVLGDQRDLGKVLVELVRANLLAAPLQDDVRRRHRQHLAGVGVERVLARQQRSVPYAAPALGDQLAVLVVLAREVRAGLAGVGDDHANAADVDHRLRDHLDRGEQPVDVVGALDEHLQLPAAHTSSPQELIRVLEVVMVGFFVVRVLAHRRRDDLALRQRRPVVDGHDADVVVRAFDHHRPEAVALGDHRGHLLDDLLFLAVERQREDPLLGDDDELGQVDRVGSFAQHHALGSALAAVLQKGDNVLEVVGGDVRG